MLGRNVVILMATLVSTLFGCGDDADAGMDAGPMQTLVYGRDAGTCGDGVLDPGEECDGTVLAQSCESLGLDAGPLSCGDDCKLDRSLCGTRTTPPPDGGFLDGAVTISPDALAACEQIVACGELPVPNANIFSGATLTQTQTCALLVQPSCIECVLSPSAGEDDSGAPSCSDRCRPECADLALHVSAELFGGACEAAAAELFDFIEPGCVCATCSDRLSECINLDLCYRALSCMERTGCSGAGCSSTDTCQEEVAAAVFNVPHVFDPMRECLTTFGCQVP